MIHVGMGNEDCFGCRQVNSRQVCAVGATFASVKPEQSTTVLNGERGMAPARHWLRATARSQKIYLNTIIHMNPHLSERS